MAQQAGRGQPRPRNSVRRTRKFLAEATAAAEATGDILVRRFGSQQWILQVMEAVQNAVQNGIENLSATQVGANSHPGDEYRFRARTREELIESAQLAAESRGIDPRSQFRNLQDPAKQFGNIEHDQVNQQIRSTNGLILPAGYAPPPRDEDFEQPKADGNRADQRKNTDPMPWLL